MSRHFWVFVAGLSLLLATGGVFWRESHQPWQTWQQAYNAQPGAMPVPVSLKVLVPTQTGKPEMCLTCHYGIEDISPSHPAQAIGCVVCHGGEPLATDADRAHVNMYGKGNPSDLSVAGVSCGTRDCHGEYADEERNHVDRVSKSLQATYAGGIAALRYTFGAQTTPEGQFGTHSVEDRSKVPVKALPSLKTLPEDSQLNSVDARFQSNCLTGGCHLWSQPTANPYYYRSTGCAACHYLYNDDGLYRGSDPTIPRNEPGHGTAHRLTTAIPFTQCNHCHNRGNYSLKQMVFLPREDLPPLGAPVSAHMPPEGRRLIEYYQPIAEFARCEYELNCIDCHTSQEVMGDGHIYAAKKDVQYIQCQTCHGTLSSGPRVSTIEDVNELAMRQARIAEHSDFLQVADKVITTERGDLLWSVKQTAPREFVQIDKTTGKLYKMPLVMGSKCEQDGKTQTADYCHKCHSVMR